MLFLSRVAEKLQNLKPHPLDTRESSEENRMERLSVCSCRSTCAPLGSFLEMEWLEAEGWGACCKMGYHHSPQRTWSRASAKHFRLSAEEHGAGSKGQNSCQTNGCCQWGIGPNHKEGVRNLLTDPPTPAYWETLFSALEIYTLNVSWVPFGISTGIVSA